MLGDTSAKMFSALRAEPNDCAPPRVTWGAALEAEAEFSGGSTRVTETIVGSADCALWRFHPQNATPMTINATKSLSAVARNSLDPSCKSSVERAFEGRIPAAGGSDSSYSPRRAGLASDW